MGDIHSEAPPGSALCHSWVLRFVIMEKKEISTSLSTSTPQEDVEDNEKFRNFLLQKLIGLALGGKGAIGVANLRRRWSF